MLQGTVGSPSLPHKLLATFHFFRQTTLQFFAVLYSYQEYPVKCSLSRMENYGGMIPSFERRSK